MRGAVFSHSTRWLHGERRRSEGSLAGSCQGAELAVSRGRAARAGRRVAFWTLKGLYIPVNSHVAQRRYSYIPGLWGGDIALAEVFG